MTIFNIEMINLKKKIYEWIEFQQRSCIDAPYGVELIAYELHVAKEDILDAIADDEQLTKVII